MSSPLAPRQELLATEVQPAISKGWEPKTIGLEPPVGVALFSSVGKAWKALSNSTNLLRCCRRAAAAHSASGTWQASTEGSASYLWVCMSACVRVCVRACVCPCVCFYPWAHQGAPQRAHLLHLRVGRGLLCAPGSPVPASPALRPQGPCISYVPLCLLWGPAFHLGPSSSPGWPRAPCLH